MRKLKTADVFAATRLIKKLGLKEEAKAIAGKANEVQDIWSMGFDFVWGIFDRATDTHGEALLCEFLAGPFEKTPEEMADMEVSELMAGVKQLAEENDLLPFFKNVAKLTTR